jgi:tetratricopeptide (TPR) repeat protein
MPGRGKRRVGAQNELSIFERRLAFGTQGRHDMNGRLRLLLAPIGLCAAIGFALGGGVLPANAQPKPYVFGDQNPEAAPSTVIVEAARKAVAAGKLDDAIGMLSAYVKVHPNDIEPAKYLGDLYYRQADLPKAEAVYRHVLEVAPKDRETHNRLGGIYAAQDRVSEAIDQFTMSLPAVWNAYGQLVELHRRRGDLGEFVNTSKRRADDFPLDYVAQYNMGRIFDALHDYRNAAFYLNHALGLAPKDCSTMSALGSVFLDLGDTTHALSTLNRCLLASPDDYSALVNRGDTYIELAQDDLARADLDHANRVRPDGPEALVDIGYLEDLAHRWRSAITYYLRALAIDPLMREAYTDLGYDYDEHQLYALAEAAYLKGLSITPSDGRLHYLLAVTYADQGKRGLALAEYQRATASDEEDVARAANRDLAGLQRISQ